MESRAVFYSEAKKHIHAVRKICSDNRDALVSTRILNTHTEFATLCEILDSLISKTHFTLAADDLLVFRYLIEKLEKDHHVTTTPELCNFRSFAIKTINMLVVDSNSIDTDSPIPSPPTSSTPSRAVTPEIKLDTAKDSMISLLKSFEEVKSNENCVYINFCRDLHAIILHEMEHSTAEQLNALINLIKPVIASLNQLHEFGIAIESALPASHRSNVQAIKNIITHGYELYLVGLNAKNREICFNSRDIINNDVLRMEIFIEIFNKVAAYPIPATIKTGIFQATPNPLAHNILRVLSEFRSTYEAVVKENAKVQYDDELRASGHKV